MNATYDQKSVDTQSNSSQVISNFVSWSWLERFESVRNASQKIIGRLHNDQSKALLQTLCARYYAKVFNHYQRSEQATNHLYSLPIMINESDDVLSIHNRWNFEQTTVEQPFQNADELYVAMGNFSIYVAVTKAQIERVPQGLPASTTGLRLRVKEVGLYVRNKNEKDSYTLLSNLKRQTVNLIVDL